MIGKSRRRRRGSAMVEFVLAGIPVIVASADPLASLAENMGVSAVMQKPVDPRKLLAAVASTALSAPQAGARSTGWS